MCFKHPFIGGKIMVKILIVEDEQPISRLIQMSLNGVGYQCVMAFNGNEAIEKIDKEKPDLILLDIMLPEIDGYELLEYIKPQNIPVIMLTARGSIGDKVKALKCGADDYITKPFEVAELLARIESLLRRLGKLEQHFIIEDVEIDFTSRQVTKGGKHLELTIKEYDLLVLLIQNKNIALFRDVILETIWGYNYESDTRTLDLHISRLRQKMGWKEKIITIRKFGYRLEL